MQVPEFLKKIWFKIESIWKDVDKKFIPVADVAVKVTNQIKAIMDSGVPATLAAITPTDLDDKVVAALNRVLPTVVAELTILRNLAVDQSTPDVAIATLLDEVQKLLPDKQKYQWVEFSSELTRKLAADLEDGDLSITESISLAHYIYEAIHKDAA